ncbi:MAG: SWIM zinc finger family protein, partial [Verrucomicrobiota bacterium]
MIFQHRYSGSSTVESNAGSVGMSFAPDTYRSPTFFTGRLNRKVPFREAISALHDVVISDLRFTPRDLTEYKAWLKDQEDLWVAEAMGDAENLHSRIEELRRQLNDMNRQSGQIMGPYYKAQKKYFNYIYKKNYRLWFILDPVITVHPDTLFFECFSKDESSYGKLSCNYNVFEDMDDFSCGTTNIDYSDTLYDEFQKIRGYKETEFKVDPGGFEVQTTGEDIYHEVKIDLPDSWVRGFLQVSSAMTLDAVTLTLHPFDVHNICFVLRRNKERKGPRSIRFVLTPGEPVKLVFDPWNLEVVCGRSIYEGDNADDIRIWGRRRLLILERLIPVARSFKVHLLGSGMPSFYIADLGDMSFTLGLSGWTANDWSRLGNFDLMAPRADVDLETKKKVFSALKENWHESTHSLAKRLKLSSNTIAGALGAYTQAGRAIYDLTDGVYRVRELTRDPLPAEKLRFSNEREELATALADRETIKLKIKDAGSS